MIAIFCDENGNSQPGTDSMFYVDGRLSTTNLIQKARNQREKFKLHFLHKFKAFTHVYFVKHIQDKPNKICTL